MIARGEVQLRQLPISPPRSKPEKGVALNRKRFCAIGPEAGRYVVIRYSVRIERTRKRCAKGAAVVYVSEPARGLEPGVCILSRCFVQRSRNVSQLARMAHPY